MRFVEGGPAIPNSLLWARDKGQVLFFCGAGVSMAEAKLPDFVKLARSVADALGSSKDSAARHLLNSAQAAGVGVAVDRVFSLLQREFSTEDVRRHVAQALTSGDECDLRPHRSLLDLSRNSGGVPRLVTTNFDLLFERAQPGIPSSAPPRLPEPHRLVDFEGVIHLHGAVTDAYDGARHDEFVLSSAEFGEAYLSNGWATRYIKSLLERYIVVFVGYSADDPPVQYLLEAMGQEPKDEQRIYAFHEGLREAAESQWRHRGVVPISFQGFDTLWASLDAWAERARDVDAWHQNVLDRAALGPHALHPHERGMVAHIVSSVDGVEHVLRGQEKLPASWLFVFDPALRYERQRRFGGDDGEPEADPFEFYGLDDDPDPPPVDPDDFFKSRGVPAGAWDAFSPTRDDQRSMPTDACARLVTPRGGAATALPKRLALLGHWLSQVANSPVSLWWAAAKHPLHDQVQAAIERSLRYRQEDYSAEMRDVWRHLLAADVKTVDDINVKYHNIADEAAREGWSSRLVRSAIGLYVPRVRIERAGGLSTQQVDASVRRLIRLEVHYPTPYRRFAFSPEYLAEATRAFREGLERAVSLEAEIHGRVLLHLESTQPDDGEELDETAYKLNGRIALFIKMMDQLASHDSDAAKAEVASWAALHNAVFSRLRLWASSRHELTSPAVVEKTLLDMGVETFWQTSEERDLLFVMRNRWDELDSVVKKTLERRLLYEHPTWISDSQEGIGIASHVRLGRLHWLAEHGVTFGFDFAEEVARLRALCPSWTTAAIAHTAETHRTRVYRVDLDTGFSAIESAPLEEMAALALSYDQLDHVGRVQRASFLGLTKERPLLALRALSAGTRAGHDLTEGWAKFLREQAQTSNTSMVIKTAVRLRGLPPAVLASMDHAVADWMLEHGVTLMQHGKCSFDDIWSPLVGMLASSGREVRPHRSDMDWVEDAINTPAGELAETLFRDPRLAACNSGEGLPEGFGAQLLAILRLPRDDGRRALSIATLRLVWLFRIAPSWTQRYILPCARERGANADAFWAGFFTRGYAPQASLFRLLRGQLVALPSDPDLRDSYRGNLAGILLANWGKEAGGDGYEERITSAELRECLITGGNHFRNRMLWFLGNWASEEGEPWTSRVVPFLSTVWPLQQSVRNSESSAALIELAFTVPDFLFPDVVRAILPRLLVAGAGMELGSSVGDESFDLLSKFPEALLDLLWAILPEDGTNWPYQASTVVEGLSKSPTVQADKRLAELCRRRERAGLSG